MSCIDMLSMRNLRKLLVYSVVVGGVSVVAAPVIGLSFERGQGAVVMDRPKQSTRTPLHHAIEEGKLVVAKKIIDSGVDVNVVDGFGLTPLHFAVIKNEVSLVSLLLKNGADINKQDKRGDTPIHMIAASSGTLEIAQMLLANGANPNAANSKGNTALHWAAGEGNLDLVKQLVKAGAEVDIQDLTGDSSLHWAAEENGKILLNFLLLVEQTQILPIYKAGPLYTGRFVVEQLRQHTFFFFFC